MKKNLITTIGLATLLALMSFGPANAENKEVTRSHSLYFVGDAGDIRPEADALLRTKLDESARTKALFFLGDNVYPAGIPNERDRRYAASYERLQQQIRIVQRPGLRAVFVPGNHDWDDAGPDGWNSIRRQQKIVETALGPNSLLPRDGCPGPQVAFNDGEFMVFAIDSQWWLHKHSKPSTSDDGCPTFSAEAVTEGIKELLQEHRGKKVVLIQHHPLLSYGAHVEGSSPQDMKSSEYKTFIRELEGALTSSPPFLCVAGHDHDLQFLKGNSSCQNFVVSGSMSKPRSVGKGPETIFSSSVPGFFRLDRENDGRITLRAFGSEAAEGSLLWEKALN